MPAKTEECRLKAQYYTACSLDGFIATDDHSLEWLFQLGHIAETSYPEFIHDVGALAMGSATYEWMLRHFSKQGSDPAADWPYTEPCWVFSSRELPGLEEVQLHFVRGDVRPVHAAMRAAAGEKKRVARWRRRPRRPVPRRRIAG